MQFFDPHSTVFPSLKGSFHLSSCKFTRSPILLAVQAKRRGSSKPVLQVACAYLGEFEFSLGQS